MDEKSVHGIRVKNLSILLIILEVIFVTTAVFCSIDTANSYDLVESVANEYIGIQEDIYNIKEASDYLTNCARQYVMTSQPEYAQDYYEEINVSRRREKAVENVNSARESMNIGGSDYMGEALAHSDALAEVERHAMALIYSTVDTSDTDIQELSSYELSDEELMMSDSERIELANKLVFDTDYTDAKNDIDSSIEKASDQLLNDIEQYKTKTSRDYRAASVTLKVLLVVCALIFAVLVTALFTLILAPVERGIRSINEEKKIDPGLGYEFNYLVYTYNKLFDKNERNIQRLKQNAERDALTGLLNRAGYEEVKSYFEGSKEHIALMIIDVDYFKEVNDNFGHEAGDKALTRIADLIKENFRDDDFIIRYGGDEFLVIMTDISRGARAVIERKLKNINKILVSEQTPYGPKLSVSVGVAFSENGYSDELFEKADGALYRTKEKGKCGYTFA